MNYSAAPNESLILPREAGKIQLSNAACGFGIWAKWEVEVRNGSKIVDRREGPSHSFLKNFGKFMRGVLDGSTHINESLTNRTGASFFPRIKANASVSGGARLISGAGRIRFGSSNAALNSNHFDLQGTILGLTFGTTVTTLISEDAVKTEYRVEGQVTNTTGSSFTVEEMGLYSLINDQGGTSQDTAIMRDLTGSVPVANGLTILGRWTFTLSV